MYNLNSLVDEILYTPIDDSTIHFVRCQYIVGHTYRQLIAGIDIFCKYFKECTIAIPGTGVCHCVFACIRWIPFVFAIPGKMSSTLFRVFFFFFIMMRWSRWPDGRWLVVSAKTRDRTPISSFWWRPGVTGFDCTKQRFFAVTRWLISIELRSIGRPI